MLPVRLLFYRGSQIQSPAYRVDATTTGYQKELKPYCHQSLLQPGRGNPPQENILRSVFLKDQHKAAALQ